MVNQVQQYLEGMVEGLDWLGHPALMERFILRNGKPMKGTKLKGALKPMKECFANATRLSWKGGGRYIEGYALRPDLIPLHHAWVEINGKAMDPTWEAPEDTVYFGVPFDTHVVARTTIDSGVFGMLDIGGGINLDLMLEIDPGLAEFVPEGIKMSGTPNGA